MSHFVELELIGPAGEPVDLWRAINSHGLVALPPMSIREEERELEVTLPLTGQAPRTVVVAAGRPGHAVASIVGRRANARAKSEVVDRLRWILRLDADLSGFYALASDDPDLVWVAAGAGRMIRSATVFEEIVKTICTTNCTWSATERMVGALVEHLGERAPGSPPTGALGRAFPTASAMAAADKDFYRDVVRAGYRGRYLRELAEGVASESIDVEVLSVLPETELDDEEVERRLLALPGVGPYAAAHIMLMLGRYSRLILDSWTRPTYARMVGRTTKDTTIARRFRRYGPYAGLAFWLTVTRDWVRD